MILRGKEADPSALRAMPARMAHHYNAFPYEWREGALVVALADPDNLQKLDDLRVFVQKDVIPVQASPAEILEALNRHYGVGADTLEELSAGGQASGRADSAIQIEGAEELKGGLEDASVIKFVKQIFLEAFESRATDIHVEPYEKELRIRRRIDGILYDTSVPASARAFQSAIVSRIKVMANLDIGERRLPQDGRIKVKVSGNDLDLRVSVLPTPFGESVTIRFLTGRAYLDLGHLGFLDRDLKYMESLLEKPHGIALLTGPTGSGKTTTLYALLSKLNKEERKIITMEDPIEYQIKGITQVQVQPKIGLDFAAGLRSMLRHDPDVMMVGEIRDLETAEIAIRVALTGHLVFSTLHTNDAPGAVTRLLDMGLEPYLVASSLECVIAQRLVRTICVHCKNEEQRPVSGGRDLLEQRPVFQGQGCEECNFTGFHGRTVIYEILDVNPAIRDLIAARAEASRIREKALEQGMITLRQCGFAKVRAGLTTPEEVMRVTMKDEERKEA